MAHPGKLGRYEILEQVGQGAMGRVYKARLEILEQVASALDEAHRNGIVHRDVKPGNVFLDTRGRVKVGDFGIARLPESDLTETGVRLGTPGYLPPEVLQGARADARSDVFALGALAYQVLTGQKPFEGATRESIALQVLQATPVEPRSVRPEVPKAVSALVMKALRRRPEERPPNAGAFLQELRAARPEPNATLKIATTAPPPRRRLGLWVLVAAALALLGAGWLLLASRWLQPAPAAPSPVPRAAPVTRPPAAPAPARVAPSPSPREDGQRKERSEADDRKGPGHGKGRGKKKKDR